MGVNVSSVRQDAAFNKTSRSLQQLQHKDLGVKPHFRSAPPLLDTGRYDNVVMETAACSHSNCCCCAA